MNKLAIHLKNARLKAKLSQADVSKRLGYSTPQFISNWERGVSHPPIHSLKTLGALYKVDPESLFDSLLTVTVAEVTRDLKRKFASAR